MEEKMSKRNIGLEIIEGLKEAIDYSNGEKKLTVSMTEIKELQSFSPEEIRAFLKKNHLSQAVFAKILGVQPRTLEKWLSGERRPSGTAKRLLQCIFAEPGILNILIKEDEALTE
jgi:putative transcriptional regulator